MSEQATAKKPSGGRRPRSPSEVRAGAGSCLLRPCFVWMAGLAEPRASGPLPSTDAVELPDRLISPHLNLVTQSGLKALDAAMAAARAAYRAAQQIEDL